MNMMKCSIGGLQLQLIASFFQALMSCGAKILGNKGFSVFQLVFCRSIVLLNFSIWYTWKEPANPLASEKKLLLLLRGLLGFVAITTIYTALQYMPISDCTAFLFLSPVFVSALAPVILNQPLNRVATFLSIPTAFLGVLLITQPSMVFGNTKNIGLVPMLIGLSQAILGTGTKLCVSYLGATEATSHLILSMALSSSIGSAGILLLRSDPFKMPHNYIEFAWLVGLGLCACMVQLCATKALQLSSATSVMGMSYSGIVWSMLFDYLGFGYIPNFLSVVGLILVIAANGGLLLYDAMTKPKNTQGDTSEQNKPFMYRADIEQDKYSLHRASFDST